MKVSGSRLKNIGFTLLLLGISNIPLNAQTKLNSLLWKITGKSLTAPSYLFGTMHIVCPEDLQLSPQLISAISATDRTYLELDMDDMKEIMGMLPLMRMKNNVKLKDLLTEAEYERIKAFFAKGAGGLPFAMLENFKPFLVSGMIAQQMLDCKATEGMESAIMKQVKSEKKEIYGLETGAFQASIFDSIPYEIQAKELLKSVDSTSKYSDQMKQMLQAYREQNLQELEHFFTDEDQLMSQYVDLLLYGRNRNWAEKMPELMQAAPTFFAVGAGHLVGEQGVVALLRKAGYKVEPIK